jgi:hypothetical protein
MIIHHIAFPLCLFDFSLCLFGFPLQLLAAFSLFELLAEFDIHVAVPVIE